ncbi:MAG TPA: hypothetical protein VKM72_28720 [Thermoanaerobaculia bacterium]|nr:hypothetical protein [Thermoanaerobaculia bacterium]
MVRYYTGPFLEESLADPLVMERALRKTISLVGWKVWDKRYQDLDRQRRKFSISRRQIEELYHLELTLPVLYKHLMLTGKLKINSPIEGDTVIFSGFIARLHDSLGGEGKRRLEGTIKNALSSNDGFGPLRCELTALNAFLAEGCQVAAVDLEGLENFDYLCSLDGCEFEVECKFVTSDLGAKIQRTEASSLAQSIVDRTMKTFGNLERGVIVTIVTENRLPSGRSEIDTIVGHVLSCLEEGSGTAHYGATKITVEDWPSGKEDPASVHKEATLKSLVDDAYTAGWHCPTGAIMLIFKSESQTGYYQAMKMRRKLVDAAEQFSGSRPGIIFLEFENIGPHLEFKKLYASLIEDLLRDIGGKRKYLDRIILGFPGLPFSGGESFDLVNPARDSGPQAELFNRFRIMTKPVPWENPVMEWRRGWRSQWPNPSG